MRRAAADAAWVALTAGLLAMVAVSGVNFPYMDEWPMVDALAGREPLGPWLIAWHNEHLLPLPRLVFWLAFQVAHDFRVGMVTSVLLWSALARLLMLAARRARGGPSSSDVLFPLLVLNPGQFENVLMSYQVGFALSALLAGASFVLIAGGPPTPRRVAAVGACAAALPLCGGHGLLFALAGLGWLAAVAVAGFTRRGGVGRVAATVAAVGCLAGVGVASLYLVVPGKPTPPAVHPLTASRWVAGLFGFGAAGFGPVGQRLWPATAVLPGVVWGVALLAVWRGRSGLTGSRWSPSLGAIAAVAGATVLAAAVAWGRSRDGLHAVFFPRYVGLSALLPATAALLCVRVNGGRLAAALPGVLAAVALAALPHNAWSSWRSAAWLAEIQRGARDDLESGVPVEVVARQYHHLIYNDTAAVTGFVERYAASGVGRFDAVAHEPPYRVVPLPGPTPEGSARPLDGDGWAGGGPDAALAFDLPAPRFAYAVVIRGRYRYPAAWPPARATVHFRRQTGGELTTVTTPVFRLPTDDEGDAAILVWVNGPVAAVRLAPDAAPWGFRVTGSELRVPLGE